MTMTLRILDCTLRDGGYYNNWCFPRELTEEYLRAMAAAQVDIVEIGFRNFPQASFLGPHAYSTDAFLGTLDIPASLSLAVMVDAKSLLGGEDDPVRRVDALFQPRAGSRVEWVRIAAHLGEIAHCQAVVARLVELGYKVGLNMMQAAGKPSGYLTELAQMLQSWGSLDVLYFADSFGSMNPSEVGQVIEALAGGVAGEGGIHAHNNKAPARQNTPAPHDCGASLVGATGTRKGRGGGNAELQIRPCEHEARGPEN